MLDEIDRLLDAVKPVVVLNTGNQSSTGAGLIVRAQATTRPSRSERLTSTPGIRLGLKSRDRLSPQSCDWLLISDRRRQRID
jgi:hypothetical protein